MIWEQHGHIALRTCPGRGNAVQDAIATPSQGEISLVSHCYDFRTNTAQYIRNTQAGRPGRQVREGASRDSEPCS